MFLRILTVICWSSLQLSESLTLQIEGNKTSFTFPLGVTSQIEFYARNEGDFRIYVQHKAVEKDNYDTMCIVYQTASKGCNTSNNICRCPQDPDGAFSLNKTFLQSDAGLWVFKPWQHNNISKTVNVSISDSTTQTQPSVITTASTAFSLSSETFSTATQIVTDASTQNTSETFTVEASEPSTSVEEVNSVTGTTISQIFIGSSSTTLSRAALSHRSAADPLKLTKTDATVIAIIVVVIFIALLVIVLTLVVWRRPDIVLKLRRAPAIDDGGKNLYLENPSDYLLLSRQTSTSTSRGEPSSDYQTHVFDTSSNIISNSTSDRFIHAPAFCPRASRELSGHRNVFSVFGQQMPLENVPEAQGGVCKLTPSNDGCTFVNLSATTDTADDYLTPIIDFKAYMIQTRKTEGESTSDSPQSSASDEDGSPTRYRGHQNQGSYMSTSINHTDGATANLRALPGGVCGESRDSQNSYDSTKMTSL